MATTTAFKETIRLFLNQHSEKEPSFLSKMTNEDKSIDECIQYILQKVQDSGCVGFTDSEIYNMALHYFDEENVDIKTTIDPSRVIVNHVVELTEEDKAEAKEKAIQALIEEEKKKIINNGKGSVEKPKKTAVVQNNLFGTPQGAQNTLF